MYLNDASNGQDSQVLAFVRFDNVHIEKRREVENLDPLAQNILGLAQSLLSTQHEITIKDIADNVHAGDSAIRLRLAALVESGNLACVQGSGRRPSTYKLPSPSDCIQLLSGVKADDIAALQQLSEIQTKLAAEVTEQERQLAQKQSELESVQSDIETLRKAIEIKTKLDSQYLEG